MWKPTDQWMRPVWRRQSRASAERGSRFCLDWLSRTRNWTLPCRHRPERNRERFLVCFGDRFLFLFWNRTLIEIHFFHFEIYYIKLKLKLKMIQGEWQLKSCLNDFLFIWFQFLVMLNLSKQDREPLNALPLVCICPAGDTSGSCNPFPNKTRNLSLRPAHAVYARQGPFPGQLAK